MRHRSEVRYHGKKDAKLRVHVHHVSVCEHKLFLLVLLALQDNVDLLGSDGEHRQLDAVKLIEAAPGSGLGQTCRDSKVIKSGCNVWFHSEGLPTRLLLQLTLRHTVSLQF